jgi:Mn2+/Fe2+ NRAMP family transporter
MGTDSASIGDVPPAEIKAKKDEPNGGGAKKKRSPLMRFFSILGPGLVTGASDDDPSGIATYAQAGATFSNSLLWTVPFTLPLMMAVQEICDRTALATGKSLGALIREKFGHKTRIFIGVLIVALLVANTLNLAADLVAIGEGVQLLGAGPAPVWSAIAGVTIGVILIVGSFEMIAMLVLGGEGTLIGGLFGSLALTLLPTVVQDLAVFKTAVEGALLVIIFLFMPEGLFGRLVLWLNKIPFRGTAIVYARAGS